MAHDLYFDAAADEALTRLEATPVAGAGLLERVIEALDGLSADPSAPWLRRRRFSNGLWCVVIDHDDEPWVLLWEPHPIEDEAVVVQYLGPASFP